MNRSVSHSRRAFLQSSGALVVAFSLDLQLNEAAAKTLADPWPSEVPNALDAWLAIDAQGQVTLYTGKVDLGTGLETALAQIAAEELDITMQQIRVVQGDTALTPDQGPTWGSVSIVRSGAEIRRAAATARARLVALAAASLGEPAASLSVEAAVVSAPSGKRIGYGELIGQKRFELDVDPKAVIKPAERYKLVGTSVPRIDIPAKVAATFEFVHDVKVPGMLHGRVVMPPRWGATLQSSDEQAARAVPGVVQVVRDRDFLAVVARDEWAAIRGAQALAPAWTGGRRMPTTARVFDELLQTKPSATQRLANAGDVDKALANATTVFGGRFDMPYQTHGSIGPSCAVADVRGDRVTIWSATQAPHWLQGTVAQLLNLPEANVRVIYVEGAGCYGRNGHEDAAGDAVLLSRAVKAPVRVQWMRHQEHGNAPMGPAHVVQMRAAVGANGAIDAWDTEGWLTEQPKGFPPVAMTPFRSVGTPQTESDFAGFIHGNQQPGYVIPNSRVVVNRVADRPVRVSWIRGPGRVLNVFAVESVMDDMARSQRVDAVAYRLRHAPDARARQVIERVAKLANWQSNMEARATPDPGPVLRGRGLAYCRYSNASAYVAMIADVAVDRATGIVRLERMYVSHDCGRMVNPDGVLNQVEGQVIQTASRGLYEEVGFDGTQVTTLDWASYPIMRFSQSPRLFVDLVPSTEPSMGAGEPACAPVIAAIGNAIRDATGIRLRRIPFTPARVLAAMRAPRDQAA